MSHPKLKPIKPDEALAIEGLPMVADQLPVTLAGGFDVEEFTVECAGCNTYSADVRGSVVMHAPHLMEINGHGICHTCRAATPARMRIVQKQGDEAQVTWLYNHHWLTSPADRLQDTTYKKLARWFRRKRRTWAARRS